LPALLGKKLSVYNARAFASMFATDVESLYLYVGRTQPWDDDTSPPTPEDTPAYHNSIWDKMAGMIRVQPGHVSLGIKRNDWTSGTVYERYHHDNTSLGSNYYVLAGIGNRDVYKCLDNNGDSPSTSKPNHKNFGATRELDGYAWKYMYSIPDTRFKKFATANVIPIFLNRDVPAFASPGTIIHLPISANNTTGIGSFYRGLGHVNTTYSTSAVNATIFTTVPANTTALQLKVVASSGFAPVQNYYTNSAFMITSGKAKGTFRRIVASYPFDKSSGSNQDAGGPNQDVSSNLVLSSVVSNIANGDTFMIGPFVTANRRIGGRGFLAIGNTNRYGNITSISVVSSGSGYANGYSNVTIQGDYHQTSNGPTVYPDGSGADVELIIPPSGGGHGQNVAMELDAKYVIVAPETTLAKDHETGRFVGYGNDYRQVGLVRSPMESKTGGTIAYRTSYDLRTTIYFNTPSPLGFVKNQRVYNTLTDDLNNVSGLVFSICGDSTRQYLSLTDVNGQFANGDILYNRLGDSFTISSGSLGNYEYPLNSGEQPKSSVINSGIAKYTGEILYHENISPITRRLDQKEEFKFIFEF